MDPDTSILLEAAFYLLLIISLPFIARISLMLWEVFWGIITPIKKLVIEVEYNGEVLDKVIEIDNDDELIEALLHARKATH